MLRLERRLRIHERQHCRRAFSAEELDRSGMKRVLVKNELGGKEAQKLRPKGGSLVVIDKLAEIEIAKHYKEGKERRLPVSTMHNPITTAAFFPP